MKKIYELASFILVLALMGQSVPSRAQDMADAPLYIQAEGEIYKWAGAELILPDTPTCNGLSSNYAPNASCLYALTVTDSAWLEAEREPFGGGIETPINILLGHLQAETELQVIAGQPEDYRIKEDGHAENFVVRGTPAWSPDGMKLAWTEYGSSEAGLALVIYDVASATLTTVVDNIPEAAYTVGGPVPVYWSTYGIIASTATLDDNGNPVSTFIRIEPESGEQAPYIYTPPVSVTNSFSTSAGTIPEVRRFYTDSGLVILYNNASWQVLYWADGTQADFTGKLAVVSALAPAGLQVQLRVDATLAYTWTVVTPEGNTEQLALISESIAKMAISPDGTSLAYIDGEDVQVWKDQVATNLELGIAPDALWWSPLVWQIAE